jgi:ParB/RepB/Spo0J family partition protein
METTERRPKKSSRSKIKVSSAAVEAAKRAVSDISKSTRELTLPKTQKTIQCELMALDPKDVKVPGYNMRDQSLLQMTSPSVRGLYDSLITGQIEPVLVNIKNGQKELVYGSRRKYCIERIQEEVDPARKLIAWVVIDLTEEDARAICLDENEKRSDISHWEKGKYIHKMLRDNPQLTQTNLAEDLGVTQSMISKYLTIYSIPHEVVSRIPSPDMLNVKSARDYHALTKSILKPRINEAIQDLSSSYESFVDLMIDLQKNLGINKNKNKTKTIKPIIYEVDGVKKVKISDDTEKNTLKAEFFGVSQDEKEHLLNVIKSSLCIRD